MRRLALPLLLACIACAADELDATGTNSAWPPEVRLHASDFDQTWYRLSPPGETPPDAYQVVASPDGYWARWAADVSGNGQGKTLPEYKSALYHSSDGRSWTPIEVAPTDFSVGLRSLTWGNGRYVLMGSGALSDHSLLRTSEDGRSWTEQRFGIQVDGGPGRLRSVHHVGGRFFALSDASRFLTSVDGRDWQVVDAVDTWQQKDIAFGDGRYLLAGNGPLQVSDDGLEWRALAAACDLPCCAKVVGRPYFFQAVFGSGHFQAKNDFADSSLRIAADDALACDGTPIADAFVADHFASRPDGGQIELWREGQPATGVSVSDGEPPDGSSCLERRCLVVDGALLLIP